MTGCSTMRDSLIVGAGSGVLLGGIAGNQMDGDRGENAIKGAVIGGVVGGLASYFIHNSLESRDARVRKETLLNLENYEVLGFDGASNSSNRSASGKCFTTKDVDGRSVSVPCGLVNDRSDSEGGH